MNKYKSCWVCFPRYDKLTTFKCRSRERILLNRHPHVLVHLRRQSKTVENVTSDTDDLTFVHVS